MSQFQTFIVVMAVIWVVGILLDKWLDRPPRCAHSCDNGTRAGGAGHATRPATHSLDTDKEQDA